MKIIYSVSRLFVYFILINPFFVSAAEVNIYSARKEALIKPLFDQFTNQTDIKVNLVTGKADALIKRLEVEGDNSPADLLLTVDVARLDRANQKMLFQSVNSEILNNSIPEIYRHKEGYWFGLSLRSRVIIYAKDRVNTDQLESYEALANPEWKGKLCVRSSDNVYNQSLVASLIVHRGIEETEEWAQGLVKNFARPPRGGDRDQIKAVASGQCDVALVNTYYLGGMQNSVLEEEKAAAAKVGLFWPNQSDRGTHINISGAGVTKSAKNKEEAVKLLEFLVGDEAQKWYADKNYEYPVKPGISINETLKKWGNFVSDEVNIDQLGKLNAEAVRLMDRAGWK
jgi:iron(III) transport system substrate-binding protein